MQGPFLLSAQFVRAPLWRPVEALRRGLETHLQGGLESGLESGLWKASTGLWRALGLVVNEVITRVTVKGTPLTATARMALD
jgi:uncharacterized membrane protein YccF (DUF307 family)